MDPALLVDKDIAIGRKFANILKKSTDVQVEAAFWWREDGEWRFIVATPIVPKQGRMPAYAKIREAMGAKAKAKEFETIFSRLRVLSPNEDVISYLDGGAKNASPLDRWVFGERINRGAYVEGAYFYHFAPHSFRRRLKNSSTKSAEISFPSPVPQ